MGYREEIWRFQKFEKKATDCETYFGSNLATNIKNDPYSRIRSCNEILEGVDKYGQDLSEAAIKKAKGQAYFFRAMQLFDLVRVYGAVPVVNKVLMGGPTVRELKIIIVKVWKHVSTRSWVI